MRAKSFTSWQCALATDETGLLAILEIYMSTNVALRRIVIPYSAIAHLSKPDRYSLHLLGHIFNETIVLLKMTYATQVKRGTATEAETAGGVCQATLFCRLLAGKIYEAQVRINSAEVRAFLTSHCFPYMPDGTGNALQKAFNSAASTCKWLNGTRNGHAMHYPGYQQCEAALDSLERHDAGFEFIHGDQDGNLLYHSSDAMAGMAFFHEVDSDNWLAGAEAMINDLHRVGASLCEFIQVVLQNFVERMKSECESVTDKPLPAFNAPDFDHFEAPYFFTFSGA